MIKHKQPNDSAENDFPSYVKQQYDDGLKRIGGKLWGGMLTVASGGFFKGLIMMAGVTIASFGLATALFGAGTFAAGMVAGASFLGMPIGIAALALGGVLGGYYETRVHQSSQAQAERLEQHYAKARERAPERAQTPANDIDISAPTTNFRAREEAKRGAKPQRAR